MQKRTSDEELDKHDPGKFVVNTLTQMLRDKERGFEVFIIMKNQASQMKRFLFYEKDGYGFKGKIEQSIAEAIKGSFLANDAEYVMAENIADNQNKFYVIEQNNAYKPLEFLKNVEIDMETFCVSDRDEADAILFRFRRDGGSVWAYQQIVAANVPNKKQEHFLAKIVSTEHNDRFIEMNDILFPITKRINLLVIGDYIITKDISLMQRHLKFETFIRTSAAGAAAELEAMNLVSDSQKLFQYVQRTQTKYAKKMMRIKNYHVINKTAEELLERINTVDRWRGVFDITDGRINLRTYKDVENLIDLFDERFTTSLVTGDEFDTDVKKLAGPIR